MRRLSTLLSASRVDGVRSRVLSAVVSGAVGIAVVMTSSVSASPSDEPGGDAPVEPTEIEPPQDPPPVIYPGTYTGTNTLSASGLVFTTPEGSGTASLDFDGSFDLTIADDLTSEGLFILGGLWGMEIATGGGPAVIDGSSSGAGTLEGYEDELVAAGEETTVFTVSVGGAGGSSFSGTDALPEASFRISVASCSELQGTWRHAWQGIAADVGYTNSEILFGDFWGIRTSSRRTRSASTSSSASGAVRHPNKKRRSTCPACRRCWPS